MAGIKFSIEIELSEADGVAKAIVTLDDPISGPYSPQAVIYTSGQHAYGTMHGANRATDYADPARAMQAAIRSVSNRVVERWENFSLKHGTGAR